MNFDQWIDSVNDQVHARLGREVRTQELSWDSAHWVSAAGTVVAVAHTADEQSLDPSSLKRLSVEQLMEIDVTSVSKRSEPLSTAAAAITVITAEDIRRSGVTTLPEALRLAPGLEVARADGHTWAISARVCSTTGGSRIANRVRSAAADPTTERKKASFGGTCSFSTKRSLTAPRYSEMIIAMKRRRKTSAVAPSIQRSRNVRITPAIIGATLTLGAAALAKATSSRRGSLQPRWLPLRLAGPR